jgi:hypothetical protein
VCLNAQYTHNAAARTHTNAPKLTHAHTNNAQRERVCAPPHGADAWDLVEHHLRSPRSSALSVDGQRCAACCTPWACRLLQLACLCCRSHAADLVEHLLSNRADPQPLDHFGATPLSRARFYRRESVIAVLEPYVSCALSAQP